MSNGNKNGDKKDALRSGNIMSVAAIIVVGVFVLCVIFVLAKGLFKSNSSSVPDGLYTGTVSPEMSAAQTEAYAESKTDSETGNHDSGADENSSQTDSQSGGTDDSEASVSSESTDESSIAEAQEEKAYITEYAYLRTEPNKDAEQIVCMSPNIEVTVLERDIDGYCLITFMNIDGQLTGYVYEGYLSDTPIY